jgi:hypothetical protein
MAKRDGYSRQPFELDSELSDDPVTRDIADRTRQFFDGIMLARFEGDHFAISLTRNGDITFPHNFNYAPKDLWITSEINKSAGGSYTISYDKFDKEKIEFSVSGLVIANDESIALRFFCGSFVNDADLA